MIHPVIASLYTRNLLFDIDAEGIDRDYLQNPWIYTTTEKKRKTNINLVPLSA